MGQYTRRILAGPLLVLALGAGLGLAPESAQAATVPATIDVRSTLKVRSAPTLAASVVGSLTAGTPVVVNCAVVGQTVRGSVRTTNLWDRLADGTYLTDAYVRSAASIPRCPTASPQAQAIRAKSAVPVKNAPTKYLIGTVRSGAGKVNIRTAPSVSAPVKQVVGDGATVQEVCGVVGTLVVGTVRTTTQWNRLADGSYISHAYVSTRTLHLCVGAPTPQTSPSVTPTQFLAAAIPGAQAGWRQYGVPASVTIAQAILESGWGRSSLSTIDRNYFGIKCQNGWYGTIANGCHLYPTSECTKAGTCFATTAAFRTYATMGHSIRDHGNFLKVNSRYMPAFAYTRDANKFIWQVWKAGYATDPNYYTKVTTLMSQQHLYQYDVWK